MPGSIVVLNAGSSSLKVGVFGTGGADGPARLLAGQVEGIGIRPRAVAKTTAGEILLDQTWPSGEGPATHEQALALMLGALNQQGIGQPAAVGHRVVHGGSQFSAGRGR